MKKSRNYAIATDVEATIKRQAQEIQELQKENAALERENQELKARIVKTRRPVMSKQDMIQKRRKSVKGKMIWLLAEPAHKGLTMAKILERVGPEITASKETVREDIRRVIASNPEIFETVTSRTRLSKRNTPVVEAYIRLTTAYKHDLE